MEYLKEEKVPKTPGTPESNKSDSKPRQYLFGSLEKPKNTDKVTKEYGGKDDRFKTITINSLRRSFRDSFLESSKPNKGREHQPLWFIDVKDAKKQSPSPKPAPRYHKNVANDSENIYENTKPLRGKSSISRNETFRVDERPAKYTGSSLSRKETFRVDEKPESVRKSVAYGSESRRSGSSDRRKIEPVRVELISPNSDRSGKLVPVGITAPYSALNDAQERARHSMRSEPVDDYHPYKSSSREHSSNRPHARKYNETQSYDREKGRNEEYPTEYPRKSTLSSKYHRSFDHTDVSDSPNLARSHLSTSRSDHDRSPTRKQFSSSRAGIPEEQSYDPSDYAKPASKSVIELKPRDDSPPSAYERGSSSHGQYRKDHNEDFTRTNDMFARRSLKNTRSNPDELYTKQPYRIGSFRSAIDRKQVDASPEPYKPANRPYLGFKDMDEIDTKYSKYEDNEDQVANRSPQSWRNISSRPLSTRDEIDPSNRSFVPYHNYDKQPNDDDQPTRRENNRTTININYNYNTNYGPTKDEYPTNPYTYPSDSTTRNQTNSPIRKQPPALTATPSLKSNRDKPNKNRSVNFPSVEYEVRLISPNYESSSRRRVKPSTNAVDWTFNKVHI